MDFRHLNPFFNENDVIDDNREDYLNTIDNYTINIKKSMKIYEFLYNNEKDIKKQKEYMNFINLLYDQYMDMQFREFYKNHKNYGSLC
jgi:hypothetical protein